MEVASPTLYRRSEAYPGFPETSYPVTKSVRHIALINVKVFSILLSSYRVSAGVFTYGNKDKWAKKNSRTENIGD